MHLNGQKVVAKYIHVPLASNPIIYGCMEKGGEIQYSEVHAAQEFNTNDAPHYTLDDLRYLCNDYSDHYRVDLALSMIPDQSLWAKVQHYLS
jgi:hypothetical protein